MRLAQARIFTKLDVRGAYNLIRMKEGDELENGVQNAVRSVRVVGNAIRAHQRARDVPEFH